VVEDQDTVVTEQVIPHGSVAGQITTSTAAVAAGAYVGLVQFSGAPAGNVLADRDGRYAFPFVAPGRYAIILHADEDRNLPARRVSRRPKSTAKSSAK